MPTESELSDYYKNCYGRNHDQENIQQTNLNYFRSHVNELLMMAGVDRASATIVDYGCSYPQLLRIAKEIGFGCVIGVDYDDTSVAYGKKIGIEMYTPGQFVAELDEESVDIVRMSHVLEHSISPSKVVGKVASRLKHGGIMHVTQPSHPVLSCDTERIELKDAVWPKHLHFFSPISIVCMIESAGLTIERFFTSSKADEALVKHVKNIDLAYSAIRLRQVAHLGDQCFGKSGNYPAYAGENSTMYCLKR